MINIKKSEKLLNINDITQLEKRIKLKLPKDYCEFLLEYNGGDPESNIINFKGNSISINYFLGLDADSIYDLEKTYFQVKNRIPKYCIPICAVEGGNLLILNYIKGLIYFWDHEEESNRLNHLTIIANNFQNLLDIIQPFDIESVNLDNCEVFDVWVDPEFLKEVSNQNK